MRPLLILSLALAMAPTSPAQTWKALRAGDTIAPDAHGSWQSRGYGWVVDITAGGIAVYDSGPAGCVRNEETESELEGSVPVFSREGDALRLAFRPENSTQYVFDPIPGLPAACATPPGDSPREVFDYLWTVMDQHYAFFDLHGVDWRARYDRLAPTVTDATTDAELKATVLQLMEGLDDGHLNMMMIVDGERDMVGGKPPRQLNGALQAAFEAQDEIPSRRAFVGDWVDRNRARLEAEILDGPMTASPNGRVRWGRAGDIGYVAINGMEQFASGDDVSLDEDLDAVDAILSQVVRDLEDTDAMIVDVAFNQGGYDEVALAVAAHFADARTLALTKETHGAPDEPAQAFHVVPAGVRYLNPVVVLTSDVTVSAAEVFTIAMRALPTVTHAGSPTRGAFSDVLIQVLPNGWMMTLSNEIYRDAEGELWERRGIEPDEHFPMFSEGDLDGHIDAIRQLAARLGRDR
ncbi:MAG: S41 family peptidase [Bacteroidota bacterium]